MTQEFMHKTTIGAKDMAVTVHGLTDAANALALVLEEETSFLNAMQLDGVGALQERKIKLTGLMERYIRYISKNPQIMADITPVEKAALLIADRKLKAALKENYEKLLVARAVNGAIVTCVTGVMTSRRGNKTYNAQGQMYSNNSYTGPVSMTLNKMA